MQPIQPMRDLSQSIGIIGAGPAGLSAADQLQGTLDKHFAGQSGLVIAEVDLFALGATVKWEVSRGNALFPHIYGPLPMAAVLGVQYFP